MSDTLDHWHSTLTARLGPRWAVARVGRRGIGVVPPVGSAFVVLPLDGGGCLIAEGSDGSGRRQRTALDADRVATSLLADADYLAACRILERPARAGAGR